MNKLKPLYRTVFPKFARWPLLFVVGINMLVYYASQLISSHFPKLNWTIPLDDLIPFFSPAIIVYVLSFVFWVVGYILIARESPEVCYELLSGEMIAKLICLFFFLAFPCTMVQPTDVGGGFTGWLTSFIYAVDNPPANLFPSIHCLASWFCFRGAMYCKKIPAWWKIFSFVFAVMIFASTVLVKQHVIVDVPAGILVLEIGLFIGKKCKAGRLLAKFNDWRYKGETE